MHSVSKHMRLKEPTTKIWIKKDPYYQRRRCSPISDNIRFMWIFAGVPWRGGVKRQSKTSIFSSFTPYFFGTLGNEANIIIWHYLVPCFISTDLKIHDVEWPWNPEWLFYVKFSLSRTRFSNYVTYLL